LAENSERRGREGVVEYYRKRGLQVEATAPVGGFPANPWGLLNVHGNVWEWCEDVWHGGSWHNYEGAPTDGTAWTDGGDPRTRVYRGGCWNWIALGCRSANRDRLPLSFRRYDLGFRPAADLPPLDPADGK
jgi:formylglycine-generating enzyme required for sulfatase activity